MNLLIEAITNGTDVLFYNRLHIYIHGKAIIQNSKGEDQVGKVISYHSSSLRKPEYIQTRYLGGGLEILLRVPPTPGYHQANQSLVSAIEAVREINRISFKGRPPTVEPFTESFFGEQTLIDYYGNVVFQYQAFKTRDEIGRPSIIYYVTHAKENRTLDPDKGFDCVEARLLSRRINIKVYPEMLKVGIPSHVLESEKKYLFTTIIGEKDIFLEPLRRIQSQLLRTKQDFTHNKVLINNPKMYAVLIGD